ncbi:hypothetical protein Hesp01_19210 [Herbidospora sp. NBRC 101105]|nr:hypothetical protein Hesp01_19210 [Herbidospora sp. NBRC 101105]
MPGGVAEAGVASRARVAIEATPKERARRTGAPCGVVNRVKGDSHIADKMVKYQALTTGDTRLRGNALGTSRT